VEAESVKTLTNDYYDPTRCLQQVCRDYTGLAIDGQCNTKRLLSD
jgi:hypothetical protein